jgi:hypothetical protein
MLSNVRKRPSQEFPVTDCSVLAYSCAAARDSHPLPSSSVLTSCANQILAKNKTEQDGNLIVLWCESQRGAGQRTLFY